MNTCSRISSAVRAFLNPWGSRVYVQKMWFAAGLEPKRLMMWYGEKNKHNSPVIYVIWQWVVGLWPPRRCAFRRLDQYALQHPIRVFFPSGNTSLISSWNSSSLSHSQTWGVRAPLCIVCYCRAVCSTSLAGGLDDGQEYEYETARRKRGGMAEISDLYFPMLKTHLSCLYYSV